MTFRARFPAAIALVAVCAAASAAPETAPHAAACVAALEAQETTLAQTLKGGEPVQPELLKVVRSGIAIIGTQYLAGLREAEARELSRPRNKTSRHCRRPPRASARRNA